MSASMCADVNNRCALDVQLAVEGFQLRFKIHLFCSQSFLLRQPSVRLIHHGQIILTLRHWRLNKDVHARQLYISGSNETPNFEVAYQPVDQDIKRMYERSTEISYFQQYAIVG